MSREYKAFISYRHTPLDMKVAKAVHTLVEQYRIPKGLQKDGKNRLGLVFRDQEELPVSSNLSDDICNALDHAEFLIVICTPNTPKSIWVQREIEYFLSKHPREKVLAVLAEGEPYDAFPEKLRYTVDPETGEKKDVEPLACDVRGKNDREVLANIKKESPRLFAAMLGCPYDNLVMREQKRKRKRLLITVSAILAIVLAFTILAVANNIKLNKKNEELEAQRLEILKRESEMLTVNAEDALANGDYTTAVRHAINALPHGENSDRPYIAGAEAALIKALDIFNDRNDEFWMVDTVLSQETKVIAYNASPDGSRVATVDSYGTVNMFDTVNGKCIFTRETKHNFDATSRPLFTGESIILHSSLGITAHDINSGETLWSYESPFTTFANGLLMTEDGSAVVCIKETAKEEKAFDRSCISAVKLSCKDGSVISEAVLLEDAPHLVVDIPDGRQYGGNTPWGDLSSDGNILAGAYIYPDEEYKYSCNYYIVDFNEGSTKVVYVGAKGSGFDVPYSPIAIDFDTGNGIIKAVCNSMEDDVAVTFIAIDTAAGNLKWETKSAIPEEEYISYGSERRAFFTEKSMIVSAGSYMFLFDAVTGEYKVMGVGDSDVVALSPMENDSSFFYYVKEDGTYAYAWNNGSSIVGSVFFDNYGDLREKISSAAVVCGGSFAPTVVDGKVEGQTAGNEEQGMGYVAIVPAENYRTVKIFRAVPMKAEPTAKIEFEDISYAYEGFFSYGDDLVAVGTVTAESDSSAMRYDVINTRTREKDGSIPYYKNMLDEGMYFSDNRICYLPDYGGFIACEELGDIVYHDGEKNTVLIKKESVELDTINGIQYLTSRHINTSAVMSETKNVITASVDTEKNTLTIWENGKEIKNLSLEDASINFFRQTGGSRTKLLYAGTNGYIIMSNYAKDAEEDILSDFAIYDIKNDRFSFIKDSAGGSSQRKIVASDTHSTFAVADEDGKIRIYDAATSSLRSVLDLPVPVSSVSYMDYSGRYIAVKTEDNQLFIYTGDGSNVFRDSFEFYGDIDIFSDDQNDRLFIKCDGNAICLERKSWQIIATIDGFIGYIPESNEIYINDSLNDCISIYTLPSTNDMIEKAKLYVGN